MFSHRASISMNEIFCFQAKTIDINLIDSTLAVTPLDWTQLKSIELIIIYDKQFELICQPNSLKVLSGGKWYMHQTMCIRCIICVCLEWQNRIWMREIKQPIKIKSSITLKCNYCLVITYSSGSWLVACINPGTS